MGSATFFAWTGVRLGCGSSRGLAAFELFAVQGVELSLQLLLVLLELVDAVGGLIEMLLELLKLMLVLALQKGGLLVTGPHPGGR